ncbi:MAG: DsbA family protein [Anaerolineales bacterium]|nr:DsbA family protein [Anaerolineales bacterium]MCB8954234.1 DsbA family protein [Ardenticatenales bacterium]
MKPRLSPAPLLFLGSLLLLFIIAACGPVEPSVNEGDTPAVDFAATANAASLATSEAITEASVDPELPAESPASNVSANAGIEPTINIDPNSSAIFAEGLQVGFTVEGYPYMGDPSAPVVMEEYSDYQCPFCSRFFTETFAALRQNQIANGEVVFIFRDFPLTSIHPQAVPAANAARCAGAQGAAQYWAMHDLLFSTVSQWANAGYEQALTNLANQAGLDMAAFSDCFSALEYNDAVKADAQDAQARGVNSTPSFFINNQPLVGAQPLAVFNQAIETVMNGEQIAAAETEAQPDQPVVAPTPATLTTNFAAAKGDPGAPVTIIEFTDYQCPYCQRHFAETLPSIMQDMVDTGQVYYIIKDLPLENIHPAARAAANAARCAGDQGAYWEMHDILFARQPIWSDPNVDTTQSLIDLAVELGLDQATFSACLTSQKYDSEVINNKDEALALGVDGTPFFFINGYPLNGARPIEHFQIATSLAAEGRLAEAYVPQPTPTPIPTPSGPVNVSLDDSFGIGNPDAPVTIVEFTDFQCPFCSRHHAQTFPSLLESYINTGQVYYVIKDFPLTSIHPQAFLASQAAWCASEQSASVEMIGLLFSKQGEWGNENAANLFTNYAGTLGLDTASFNQCLQSGQYDDAINRNLREGASLGITGTPTFFINGNMLVGAQPLDVFNQAIEQSLAGR